MINLALEFLCLFWINTLSLKLRKKRKGYVEHGEHLQNEPRCLNWAASRRFSLPTPFSSKLAAQKLTDAFYFPFVFGVFVSHSSSKASGDIKFDVAILCRNRSLAQGSLVYAR